MDQVRVPIFRTDENGDILPNPLFHRSWDKLHSRCVEYPYAASRLMTGDPILDVGTVKTDPAWISWLRSLDAEVHATDYDPGDELPPELAFTRADVRDLPYADSTFETVLAVSVIEHIGLDTPQVREQELPAKSRNGDVEAIKELTRVLHPNGRLIMTLPFGVIDGLILGDNSARGYTRESLQRFDHLIQPEELHYYEYQHASRKRRYVEYSKPTSLIEHLKKSIRNRLPSSSSRASRPENVSPPNLPGAVTWRRVPIEEATATHYRHTDGVVCGVWRPRS